MTTERTPKDAAALLDRMAEVLRTLAWGECRILYRKGGYKEDSPSGKRWAAARKIIAEYDRLRSSPQRGEESTAQEAAPVAWRRRFARDNDGGYETHAFRSTPPGDELHWEPLIGEAVSEALRDVYAAARTLLRCEADPDKDIRRAARDRLDNAIERVKEIDGGQGDPAAPPFDTRSPCGDPNVTVAARDAVTGDPTMFVRAKGGGE